MTDPTIPTKEQADEAAAPTPEGFSTIEEAEADARGSAFAPKADVLQVRAFIERLAEDFMRLTDAVRFMNHYQHRIQRVEDVCAAILAPDPASVKANDAVAEIRGATRVIGPVNVIVADWDVNFAFTFSFRGVNGHSSGIDGFDLRVGTPGLKALKEALDILNVKESEADLTPPETPTPGNPLARRVIYARRPEVAPV